MSAGILNVNKPRGMTSFAVVSLVRKLTGIRRVGHAGTLDPVADGVLPVCLGPATRIVEYLVSAPKRYRSVIRLGEATDTYDSEGAVVATGDASGVTHEQVEALLPAFTGEIDQLPPMYSAVKYAGRPLYAYARAGKEAPRQARRVTIHWLRLLRFEPPEVEVELEVGRGAYVRTLAYDLGERLGCHAHLTALTRTHSGPFTLQEAITPDQLREAAERGGWEELLYPVDRVLESWQAALLGEGHARDVCRGRLVVLEPVSPGAGRLAPDTLCRAYSEEGDFLGILRHQGGGRWHPERVFASP